VTSLIRSHYVNRQFLADYRVEQQEAIDKNKGTSVPVTCVVNAYIRICDMDDEKMQPGEIRGCTSSMVTGDTSLTVDRQSYMHGSVT